MDHNKYSTPLLLQGAKKKTSFYCILVRQIHPYGKTFHHNKFHVSLSLFSVVIMISFINQQGTSENAQEITILGKYYR